RWPGNRCQQPCQLWGNRDGRCQKHITDLYEDLRDGHNLISLLEVLSGVTLPREKGRMRFHRLQNVQIALDFLKQRQVKLVNIRNDDITDGNPKLTLGLIWTIILHFQISEIYVSGESGDLTAKEKLLIWSQQATEGYPGLRCVNFTSSWSDGRMFNALLHRYRPDLIDMETLSRQSNRENLEQAFEIAESLGVTRLLDAEDVDVPSPDEKSVITYVSSIYDAFPKIPEGGEGIAANEVDQRWSEYQSRFSSLLQWSRQHMALMANKNFPQNPVELKALYNEYVHFKETEIPAKEIEKGHIEHLYKLLEVWIEFGRIKLPPGLHPNDLEEEWGKLILEMLEREKALRPAVERLELLLQRANKIQNMALDCEEKLTLAKNTLQADMSRMESGEAVQCERELACYLQDCESLIRQLNQELKVLRDEKYYQVEQLAFRVSCLQEELVSLRLQCSSVYRKGHFSQALGSTGAEHTSQRATDSGLTLGQTLLGAVGAVGAVGAALLRRPMARSQLVAMSSSEDEGSLRFIYELLGWVEETQELLERAEWGADLPTVENNLKEHNTIHTAVEELMSSLQEARSYEAKVSPNFKNNYSETLAKLEHQYCKLLEHSSWRLRSLESLHAFVSHCTEELIWLNEREEEEIAFDWSDNNPNMNAKKELYSEMRLELDEKQEVMRSLQETANCLCQENHPAKQTVEAYSAALQTQWQWVNQLCVCVEQHLKDNTAYFQFMSDARDCESYLRQLQETIKRQYTCDKNSRLSKLEDLLQDSMEEKEQLIEYRSTVASLVGRAKTLVQLHPRSAESTLGTTTPIKAICDYRQIEITITRAEECVLEDNSQRTKWKVISPTGNEAMVPSVCFTIPPPNQEAMDAASRTEQLYQKVMSLWHQLHINMKSVVSWHYLLKDIRTVSGWNLDTVRLTSPAERQQVLGHLESQLADFLSDSKESALFTPGERKELEKEVQQAQQHCQNLLRNMETVSRSYLSELQNITLRLNEAEQRLLRGIETPPPSRLSGNSTDITVQITEQEKLQSELDTLRSSLGDVSRRCISFFEEKPTSSSVPVLRSELNQAVEKTDKLCLLIHSEIHMYGELAEQEDIFQSLQSQVGRAKEAGSRLSRLHPDRSPEMERYQERANQMAERWSGIKRQMETRQTELEALGSALQQYRDGHSALIKWIEETTERQENTQPGQTDSKALSEQLAQQTALVAEIEQNQTKLDECQTHSKQYCTSVKDYELQLMTYRAFVESTHKSPVKRRRMHSSSDAITQEFMDLRTRYTALVTLTTQHVKYISDALRRLEEEEVGLCFSISILLEMEVKSLHNEKKLSLEERANVEAQLDELTATYNQLCDSSTQQLQQLEQQMAKEEERKVYWSEGCAKIQRQYCRFWAKNLFTAFASLTNCNLETFPVFQAAKRGLIDQDTCHVLLEAQLIMGGLLQPDSPHNLSLEQGLAQGFIDAHSRQSLSELESALVLVENAQSTDDQQQSVLPVVTAMEFGLIREEVGLRILELQMNTGGLRDSAGQIMSLEQAEDKRLLTPRALNKLQSRLQRRELIDPNTAEKLNLNELQQRFTVRLLEAQLFGGGIADPRSGHRLTIEEAVRHGLLDQDLACAMLARQLQNGGILDPFSGERLDLEESIRRDLLSSRLAVLVLESLWAFMGILWPESGELLPIVEALQQGVISGELSRNILRQRHAIGALYNPETLQVLPLNQAAEEAFEPSVISSLKDIHIPDVLTSMNQSGTPSLNRSSWGTSSTPPPSSPSPSSSTERPVWDSTPAEGMDPEEQAKHKLLFHLMTHSYVDAHSGKRLVLLDSELVDLVKATDLVARDSVYGSPVEPQSSLTKDEQGKLQMVRQFSLKDKALSEKHHEVEEESSKEVTLSKEFEMNGTSSQKERYGGENDNNMPHKPSITVESDVAFGAKNKVGISKDAKVKAQKKEISDLESLTASAKHIEGELTKGPKVSVATESNPGDIDLQETTTTVERKTVTAPLKSEGDFRLLKESIPKVTKTIEDVNSTKSDDWKGINYSQTESGKIKQNVPITETDSKHAEPQIDVLPVEKEEEDAELRKLVLELKQGGLMTDEGERLLPDEAVAQGVLPGHTAVKLMAQAGLFGGFVDASSGESLSMEDVMQEGLLDEDLMWSVLKSDKTLAGVVDVNKKQICGVREAAQAGLIDPNTAARLLEAQVASGGIVDLRRDKKVSVTLAANLGLIEENQRDELVALEKAYKGKDTDSATALTKASLQLQMEGVIDPESKSPVPLEQAIQKGLIQSKEAYQVLARQVAEGGIVHHASGLRLSVSDAVDRGLVDRSIAPGLEELEWVYRGRVSPSSHPEAVNFQASTGAILDPESGCKLTLTEAVSKGLLDEDIASEAMASSTVTQGVLDPQTARIVPYSELVNQGTIDIETGKRFLEVKPFRGVYDVQTRENLTVPEAVASKQVDPVPALRLLQSQANSGGIIDISTGERLPLMEACKRGLVGDKMVREIATNQFLKGGLVDPATGQQVPSLNDAIAKGLISRDIASNIQEKLAYVEMEVDEGSATPVASSSDTYSPSIIMSVSCPESPEYLSDIALEESVSCIYYTHIRIISNGVCSYVLFYFFLIQQSSLIRQECLEHDQQIVALVSMVRHIEVRLKQQQQQSVGRSLIALDDIIRQTETLDLELRDLEPAISKEVEAAEELLKPKPKDVPPQLLLALEKDGRSLARGYEAARALSMGILQKHISSLLLSWLRETEARMNGGMAGMEKMEKAEKDDSHDQLIQQLSLCKSSLMARSSEVNNVAFDIQVFISERAQDLAPEQSRQLLGQLQQLQRAFHQASGQAQVVQQQKAECSQKLEGLSMWLAGAASLLASQKAGAESDDVNVLQEKQNKLKTKQEGIAEAIRSVEELLTERGESLSPEERKKLQEALATMKEQYSALTDSVNTSLTEVNSAINTTVQKSEALKDELAKFLQEHGGLGTWLEQSEQELRSLGEGETDAQDVICHKADLRFVSISGQKVLDSVQAALEQAGGSDPAMDSTKQLVTDKLQDANHRYTNLHTKVRDTRVHSRNCYKLLNLKRSRFYFATSFFSDGLEKRFGSLSTSVSERAEQLQTAVAQSVSVQEGLKGLLSWLDKLVLNPGPVEPTAQAVQDALTQNQVYNKLRKLCNYQLLSRQGSVEATRDSVSKLLQSADASTASGLQGPLDELTQRYAAAQASQAEREAELKGLLPRLESYERLGTDLHVFTQSRVKALSPAGQPDRSVDDYRQTIEEVRSELEQEASQLKSFCNLGTELSQSKAFSNTQSLLDNACEQQLLQFRGLSGSLLRWLQTAQEQLPSKEANLTTEALQRRVQQLKDLMNDWESQRSRVQELNKTGSELESLIIDITAPQAKTGKSAPQINGSAGPSSVNGIHTCKDLTELQVAVSDVNGRYEALGGELKERLGRQQASLELRQKARQGTEELKSWLTDREHSLKQGQTASPSRPEVVRAQAQENKALLSELTEHSGKVDELKSTLRKLIADNPDSPEADNLRWQTANQAAAQRQTELETCADRLGSFASAASQLGPWLREKELMMSVLGPLSIDPNMLNTQKQQVQFMLREFETRRPQFDQLTQSAEGILSQTGDSAQDPKDLEEVRSELGSISQQWEDLTNRLSQRSNHIDQAQGTSERYQALLRELSSSASALGERLDAQASLSAQPEALKRRLQETGEIRSELERRRSELAEAERLCQELSAIVAEPYLKEELSKRLESVSGPLKSLEERAADGLSQLQTALSSTQQFQQMFEELRSWLDKQADPKESSTDALPCKSEAIRSLLAQTSDLQRGIAGQRGSYELIQAEGASLLATLPAGGDERSALQSRLASLRQDWEGLNQRISDQENRLKTTLSKAETYQQHKTELTPWLAECEQKDGEIQPSLDASALDEALQKARGLSLDLERRQPLLEAFNTAADQLLEQCCIGEEEVRDEKAQLNRRVDKLGERLHNHTSQLEELACRLKEFEEGRQAAERRLEAAKHQIEVQEALGPQACSAKSLERLRSQQENLRSLKPQVVYLRDLAQGLVQDSPQTAGGSTEGTQRLQELIEQCCSTLESRLQGVGEVQSHVRDVFSRLADLDDELDSLSPVGRDADSLASQADALKGFLTRLTNLRSELEGHSSDCTSMLRREGSSPDLLALRRETEALNRQAGKLSERGQARLDQIEDAAGRVQEFYRQVAELQGLLGKAEEGLNAQGLVGTEVEMIKQQLQEFKAVEREQVDSIQPKLQHVNAVGQGLIQSAAKHTDTQALEHDLETTNLRWNSLNKRVAERIAQLQEALLHCGKFQDALEPLLSWLSDTEELVANQKPPSAEYRVVKAQIQEQKLLQRLLDDRRPTVEMIRAEGARIAATADTQDREKIQTQLQSLAERWTDLLDKASARQRQLEELQVLALEFHEALEPLGEWLSATERRLSSAEPMGTQTAKITQQIVKHKSLNEEIVSRKKTVDQAIKNGQALLKQTTGEEVLLIQEKLDGIKSRYAEMTASSSKALRTLEQALQLSTRFASAHDDVNQWLDSMEAELNNVEPDATPSYQERQKELKKVSAEKRLVLDTVNEVGSALLDLVPWRAREGLDRLVADANQRYRQADETITQRVQLVQAAIQRSQQYEEAVDAELAWIGETERKLASLGPLSLEPDVTVAQLQVQRAFNIDIIRHKDTVDQLLGTRDDILETCSDAQKDALIVKTDSLSARYDAVSQSHSERFSALEQAQVLVARFWETHEELEPWLGETETLITQLPPPAIDTDALRLQQDQMRLLRESIAEHKPHIDKLLKIGPQLAKLSLQEGASVIQRYTEAERRYLAIKEGVKGRATSLDEAVSQSAQFHDKMDPLLETLEGAVQRLRQPPSVAAEVEKIREQLAEHRAQGLELDKLLPSFSALCARGEELIGRAAHDDPAAQGDQSVFSWHKIRQRAEEREGKLNDVLDLSGKFWADVAALLSTLRDSQDIVKELEDPGVDPSLIKQQIEAAEAIKAETDGLREELEFVRTLGADLIFACGETEKPEVKKTIDEMNAAWEGLNRTWRERMERLEEAMTASVQYQDALQSMFDYLDNAVIKLCDMSTVGTDLGTVKQQIEELKQYKVEVYQQQIDMEKLCHQGELLLKKVSDQTDRDMIQEPLTELRHLWENLGDKITQRQHKLEAALLALGQFQHALSELQAWLNHTHTTLDTQRPVSSDPKAIEIELAKHHVLRNDVLSHHSTVETVNNAAAELLESSPGDEASHLRDQLDHLNQGWESLLLKTQERQKLLEAALHQAEGFHGELEEFLQWLRRTESQLSAAKPTGGLPETAREQLQQHMELQAQLTQRADLYHRLLDQGESMLLARGGEEAGPGTTQTQQNLGMLQNKWASLNTKMDDRRAKLDEAVSLATGFQTSLQDTINWLTQAEQTLNMAQPPSLMLDTVLFQIDEHKVFVNEVNTHREQVLALEKAGSQLRFASLKQDVVLIKNLLLSVQARWDKLVQRSLDRGRHLDEARKRAKQFHEAWRKLTDWLEEAEKRLDSELEISNEPDKIKVQLTKHKEFQKALGSKQPVYDTTVRSGKAMRDKAQLPADTQKLDHLVGEVRDKWDTVCGKSVERQHKLEEALLFSGQFAEALQALVDWLYRVEPQLAEDQPVHGDLDLVSNLMDSHKAFQKELGKRTGSVQALKRSARDLMDTGRDDTAWVKVQLQELSNRWDTVCALSVTKQTRLQLALKQAEEFRTAVQVLLEWLSEAEQTLRFRGVLPEEAETLQALLHTHRDFMSTVEEKRADVNKAAGMGEGILTVCHPDSITTIKHWITIIRARFEEVLTWAKQHEQRLETALTEVLNNANLLEELLSWLQWSETTLIQRDQEPLPQDIPQLKTLITEHQMFMEEMTRKQPDVDKVTKTYKRKPAEAPSSLAERRGARKSPQQQAAMQVPGGNPRLNQLCARWQQVWLLALDRQRKLNDGLDRLEELKEFANFDFDVWRKKYMRWMNHKKSRVMDFFRRIDKDQDGKITRQEFIDGILASKFPTSKLEMTAVADIFDRDGDGYIDYYEFVAALHPNKDAYRPTTDADKIEDEVTRQVAQCKCAKRFQVEQIGENKYRVSSFGDSQQLRLVRILRSTVMVRVGGGWMALDEFLVKNDPCRARGRTNLELREKFILPEGASQGLAAFRSRGRRSKPGSRNASPTRSSSSASHSGASLPSAPSAPATPTASGAASGSKLKRPTFHSSRGSLTGENGGTSKPSRTGETTDTFLLCAFYVGKSLIFILNANSLEGDPPSAVRPAEPAAGRAAEPAVAAAAMPQTHQSCKTLAPSAPTPRTLRDDPAAGPNPPRSPPSPKRPPAQRPPGLRRNNTSHRRWTAINGHFVCTISSF
uniref:Microtubule actin crosslinking factor 1 n=1 Tax=Sparus aurata TaxID=8175 RepID=A0A671XBJ7_SPAAU